MAVCAISGQQGHVHQAVGKAVHDQVGDVLADRALPGEGPVEQDRGPGVVGQVGGPDVQMAQRALSGLGDGQHPVPAVP